VLQITLATAEGGGEVMQKENKERFRGIRFKPSVDMKIAVLAKKNSLSFSDQLHRLAENALADNHLNADLESIEKVVSSIKELRTETRRVGSNINQIAYRLNVGEVPGYADLSPVSSELKKLMGETHVLLDEVLDALSR